MTIEPRELLRRGYITLAVLLAAGLVGWAAAALLAPKTMNLTVLTPAVAPGVNAGTTVEMNGVGIGTVTGIDQQSSGRLGVVMQLDATRASGLTDSLFADFAPNNLFGKSSVQITPSALGKPLRDGAVLLPAVAPADSSMSSLLRSLADLESTAFRPHMSAVLRQTDVVTKGFLPMIRALGAVAEADADTKRVPTDRTLPVLATALQGVAASTDDVLGGLVYLWGWKGPDVPGYPAKQTATIESLLGQTAPLLADTVAALQPLGPTLDVLVQVMRRVQASFPDAALNGRQFSDLIEALRRAIQQTPNGKVLNLDVQVRPVPIPTQQGGKP